MAYGDNVELVTDAFLDPKIPVSIRPQISKPHTANPPLPSSGDLNYGHHAHGDAHHGMSMDATSHSVYLAGVEGTHGRGGCTGDKIGTLGSACQNLDTTLSCASVMLG
ncbi:Uu.00g108790.m01.CDS01 [Anthostomella pinea]|uniref:Uu.00g108790.m01.CDS01 n=1 Tax=Anthostomella pinea TaxID=933095 RepID=A0AAI8V9G0_9PEZI|nr:Uu.00g108790.m01.CDS01 [Anthostomella pinea]